MKQKLFSMLALLLMAATGAVAQTTYTVAGSNSDMFGSPWDPSYTANDMTKNGDGTYSITYTNVNFTETQDVQYKVVKDHSWTEAYPDENRVINIAKAGTYTVTIHFNPTTHEVYETIPYTVTLAEGTEDADKWTIEPKMGLTGDGTETVTITYNGSKRVKSVKAVKKASGPEVTTFSELKTALSAGKDVKLMNDIVCTEEISITSDGALTIDGNGKTLSTTSAIRAFKVGSSATVAFKNLTLTGFVSGGGPAINNSGTIVLDGCTISNCHVNNTNGGGAIENKGKLYAINTTFSGNYSGEIGGAINNYMGSLYMSGCTFTNNYTTKSDAYYGGAIGINLGSEVRLINCSFSENKYGTNAGPSDIGVFFKPTNYTIAGCTGATIASNDGDITTNASGTATLDYSDLSNISFDYTAE